LNHAHYFKRNMVYRIESDSVSAIDVQESNSTIPLEPWMGVIVTLADGQHTIAELIQHMARQYPDGAPENMVDTIESIITRLIKSNIIELTPRPTMLPYYLRVAFDDQDPEEATKKMIQDGFIQLPGNKLTGPS